MKGADVVEQDTQKAKELGVKLLEKNLSQIVDDTIRHNTEAVAESVIELVCDDLKFKNKQNDPKYVMLNTKLKEEKKIMRRKRKADKKANKPEKKNTKKEENNKKSKSKFNSKYSERIQSIQESDAKRIENKKRLEQEEKEKAEFLKQIKKEK